MYLKFDLQALFYRHCQLINLARKFCYTAAVVFLYEWPAKVLGMILASQVAWLGLLLRNPLKRSPMANFINIFGEFQLLACQVLILQIQVINAGIQANNQPIIDKSDLVWKKQLGWVIIYLFFLSILISLANTLAIAIPTLYQQISFLLLNEVGTAYNRHVHAQLIAPVKFFFMKWLPNLFELTRKYKAMRPLEIRLE